MRVQFTVGLKLKGKTDHIGVDAEEALVAALKVKVEYPEAIITYVRQQNRRGDNVTDRMGSPKPGIAEQFPRETSLFNRLKTKRSAGRRASTEPHADPEKI